MPANIKQHYVPRSILKSFAFNGKRVYFLRKTEFDMPIRSENVESICKENGYYRFDIEREDNSIRRIDYDLEVFQQIDNDIAPVIRKIIEDGTITNLEIEEKKTLVRYTVYQYLRVPPIRNIANSILSDEEEAKKAHAEALINPEFVFSSLEDILRNLKLDTIKPIVGDEFLISDAAVLLDPTGEGIYFPISPDICLVYYHPNYGIANSIDSICINELQFLAATQFVIAKSELVLDKIKKSQHKKHIQNVLRNSENNSYWKCILDKKSFEKCFLEQNRNNILDPLKEEYDKMLIYFMGSDEQPK
ncbi:MAG: DUF4238 domain-containing protein [Mojavia pulchra JT2-VF2]|jgi:hypothetical protein|uniref:DUF4238 domain-containing protein n=1 Tax=Mojavia pulchra JT2-VF2 TaxID=287848 RepID=A0A951UKU4_9NOST|nr:DUF4238 domain-containing protein [Mojavia pulchra JT2-VF2]